MLNSLIRFSLNHRSLVLGVAILLMFFGTYLATILPIDVFPDLDRPRVVILTECPGLATEDVEMLVAQPIEVALLGANGVQAVRSQSTSSLNVIYVEFDWSIEVRAARQVVQERLSTLEGMLPPGVRPHMTPPSSIMGQIVIAGLFYQTEPDTLEDPASTASRSRALRSLADWSIRPRLRKIPGVAEVFVQGGDSKQFQVLADPSAMQEHGVSLQEIYQSLRESNLNTSGGFAIEGESERPIRILGRMGPESRAVLEDLERIPVKRTSKRSIELGQVARVLEGSQIKRGDGSIDGYPGIVLTIAKQPHIDTRQLTQRIEDELAAIQKDLPEEIEVRSDLFQLKKFIDRGVFNVSEALAIGAVLVVIVLFLFLLNIRTTLITLTAIPLSLVITTIVFRIISYLTDAPLSINVMTLGGIAVAMGELVDDAIVDVENIYRRLRENAVKPEPQSVLEVVYSASSEVRSSIVFGTIVVILVFLPLFALSGIEGRLFTPLGIAYIVSIIASLLVSLTVTPCLSYYLLSHSKSIARHHDGWLVRQLKSLASVVVSISFRIPTLLLALTWVGVLWGGWQVYEMGKNFLPAFDEGSLQINVTLPPGASLEASNTVCSVIDRELRARQMSDQKPDAPIRTFVRRTGRAELDEHAAPVNASEYIVSVNPNTHFSRSELIDELLDSLGDAVPGVSIEAEQPLAHLISHMISGVYAQVAIKIVGDDIDSLSSIANQVRDALKRIDGITEPIVEPLQRTPELLIKLRGDDLLFHGLTRAYVAEFLQTALQGSVVSQIVDGQRRFDVLVRLEDAYRTDYAQLGRLRIDLPDKKGQIELHDVADIGEGLGPNSVNRENARRRLIVRCNTRQRDLASAVQEIQQTIDREIELPDGFYIEYGGQFENQQSATRLIGLLALVSGFGIFLVLLIMFPSVRIVLQIMNAIPTAFIGGVAALLMTQQSLSVASMVGFISLGGIAVRNGILLVAHYRHLILEEGCSFSKETIMRGSLERLSPVLMTALTAGIGLLPLVIGGHEPGREILYPVATVILGGLVTSTFCEFLIHPGLFWKFSGGGLHRVASQDRLFSSE